MNIFPNFSNPYNSCNKLGTRPRRSCEFRFFYLFLFFKFVGNEVVYLLCHSQNSGKLKKKNILKLSFRPKILVNTVSQ